MLRQLLNMHGLAVEEFAFIAECNIGGEFMAPEKVERVNKIAGKTWKRTLDDRLGVSQEELKRKKRVRKMPLPVEEKLLADKEEHVFHRDPKTIIPEDNPYNFKLETPEHLGDRHRIGNEHRGAD